MSKYTLILARHKESLDWLKFVPAKADRDYEIVVSNSDTAAASDKINESYQRPNVGLEAGHYLGYIISHYDNLPEIMVFLQADPWPHAKVFDLLDLLIGEPSFPHPLCYVSGAFNSPGLPVLPFSATSAALSAGWESIPAPRGVTMVIGAQFYVKREVVLNRSKDHYERILATATLPSMSLAHALEGFWGHVFSF